VSAADVILKSMNINDKRKRQLSISGTRQDLRTRLQVDINSIGDEVAHYVWVATHAAALVSDLAQRSSQPLYLYSLIQ